MKVIFSNRAYTSLLSETYEKIQTETGGIFLGFYEDETWYVVEAIDPGPKSIFEVAYFEYDQKYVTHLINKIARIYKRNLSLLGLWHRHPGDFDIFSSTDDGTNATYAKLSSNGAISALVNIDPHFRLKVFHVSLPGGRVKYDVIKYQVGDDLFPEDSLNLWTRDELEGKINTYSNSEYSNSLFVSTKPKVQLDDVVRAVCDKMSPFAAEEYRDEIISAINEEEFVDRVSEAIFEDLNFLSNDLGIPVKLTKTSRYLTLIDERADTKTRISFSWIKSINEFVFIYQSTPYKYVPGLFAKHYSMTENSNKEDGFWDNIKKAFTIKKKKDDEDNA